MARSLRSFLILVFVSVALAQATPHRGVWLEIPDSRLNNTSVEENGSVMLPPEGVSFVRLHLNQQPAQVTYGSISIKINAEAANVVMVQRATAEGVICEMDLQRNRTIALHPGRNSLEVAFRDRWNQIHYAAFLLHVPEPGPRTKRRFAPPVSGGSRYALIVGVSQYKLGGAGIPNLRYAADDASSFRNLLVLPHGGGFPAGNVITLFNEDATLANLRKALSTLLARAGPEDTVVVYLNAHGTYDPNDGEKKYLLLYDSDPDDLPHSALPVSELPETLARLAATKRIVLLADTCHRQSFGHAAAGGTAQPGNFVNKYLVHAAEKEDQAALEASDIGELSAEGEKWGGGHGAFTYYLVKGLGGEADQNGDGTVTVAELFDWVQNEVNKATDGAQIPMIQLGNTGNLALSGVQAMPRRGPQQVAHARQGGRGLRE